MIHNLTKQNESQKELSLCYYYTKQSLHSSGHRSGHNLHLFKFWLILLKPGKNCRCVVISHWSPSMTNQVPVGFKSSFTPSVLAENFDYTWNWGAGLYSVTNTLHSQNNLSWFIPESCLPFSNIPLEHSYFLITKVVVPVVHCFQPVHHLLVSKVCKLGRIGLHGLIGFLSHLRQLKDTLDELDYYHYT